MTLKPDDGISVLSSNFITTLSLRLTLPSYCLSSTSFLVLSKCVLNGIKHCPTPPRRRAAVLRQISQPCMGTPTSEQLAASWATCRGFPAREEEEAEAKKEATADLAKVKTLAERLKLSTRRQSYLSWLDNDALKRTLNGSCCHDNGSRRDKDESSPDVRTDVGGTIEERRSKIDQSLATIKVDLENMKIQDQILARQLLHLYKEMLKLRLAWSCQVHQDLLDELQSNMEDIHELPNVLDLPAYLQDCPLKHVGVTRLNLSARRFSTC